MNGKAGSTERDGASQMVIGHRDRLRAWAANHRKVMVDSGRRLLSTPLASLMTWLVIAIALSLPTALYVVLDNVRAVSADWDGGAQISLFLHKRLGESRHEAIGETLREHPAIESVAYISADQALAEFMELSGFADVTSDLDNNPLPAVYIVKPAEGSLDADAARNLRDELAKIAGVERAQLDLEWIQRLYQITALARRGTLALAGLLAFGVLLVVGNTIRLAIENRREEILVVKLVGGDDAYVRRPFLYTGFWYGLGGGLLAWILVGLSQLYLSAPIRELSQLYGGGFSLQGLGFVDGLRLCGLAALLGLAGSTLAVSRHLGEIEPQ